MSSNNGAVDMAEAIVNTKTPRAKKERKNKGPKARVFNINQSDAGFLVQVMAGKSVAATMSLPTLEQVQQFVWDNVTQEGAAPITLVFTKK